MADFVLRVNHVKILYRTIYNFFLKFRFLGVWGGCSPAVSPPPWMCPVLNRDAAANLSEMLGAYVPVYTVSNPRAQVYSLSSLYFNLWQCFSLPTDISVLRMSVCPSVTHKDEGFQYRRNQNVKHNQVCKEFVLSPMLMTPISSKPINTCYFENWKRYIW